MRLCAIAFLMLWAAPSLALCGSSCLLPLAITMRSSWVDSAPVTVCPYCQNNAPTCKFAQDGSDCPTETVVRRNACVVTGITAAALSISFIDPEYQKVMQRSTLETVMTLVKKNVPGVMFEMDASTPLSTVLKAIRTGQTTAAIVLETWAEFLQTAVEDTVKTTLRENMKLLSSMKDVVSIPCSALTAAASGVYTWLWAKVLAFTKDRGLDNKAMLDMGGSDQLQKGGTSSTALTASIVRPKDEWDFFEGLNIMGMYVVGLGLCSAGVWSLFVQRAVFNTIRIRRRSWQFAHEFKLSLYEAIQDSGGKITLTSVFDSTGLPTIWERAERSCEHFYPKAPMFFRPTAERNRGSGEQKWNGKFTSTGTPCPAFNKKDGVHAPSLLLPDGTCKHNHACYKWVDNKGPGGRCLSTAHGAFACDNAHKCDARKQ
jgi:hypothetical protein